MANARKPAAAAQPKAAALNATPVVRDITFHRAVVDNMLIFGVGHDIELACLQISSNIEKLVENDKLMRVTSAISHTEVARLRMSWPTAIRAAMNILSDGIESGVLNREAVLKTLAGIEALDNSDGN